MSAQRKPFDELEQMIEQLRHQFGDLSQMEDAFGGGGITLDVEDRGDEFVVTADVPGCETDHLDVTVSDDTLWIDAKFEEATDERDANYIRRERRHRSAARSVSLPEPVEEGKTAATCNNGVLTITLPKAQSSDRGRSIDIM